MTTHRFTRAACLALAVIGPLAARAAEPSGPSFDCARAKGRVTKLICGSPTLSALDRRLSEHYNALQAQPATDQAALAKDEQRWLRDVRDACADEACIARAYETRDATLLARSRREASPAAAAETRTFPADPNALARAQSLVGRTCTLGDALLRDDGFDPVKGALPVIGPDTLVVTRRRSGADFAFLIDTRSGHCRVMDVVALPPAAQAGHLMQCTVPSDDGSATPRSVGVGLRRAGKPVTYWSVEAEAGRLVRQPLEVLGWTRAVRCQQPESGE